MTGLAFLAKFAFAAQVAAAPAPDGRVIVRLVARQQEISVTSTANGVRYSAFDKRGNTLVSNATLDELKQQHPEIYRQLAPSICSTSQAPVLADLARD